MNKILITSILLILIFTMSGTSHAQQVNFSTLPPPIAYPYFNDDDVDIKFRVSYMNFRANDLDVKGQGGDFVHRFAFNDKLAIGYQLGINYMSGKSGSGTSEFELSSREIPSGINAEVMSYRGNFFRALIFGGIHYSYLTGKTSHDTATGRITETRVMDMTGKMYGAQAGFMVSFYYGELDIAPVFAFKNQRGNIAMKSGSQDYGEDIPSFNVISTGLDIAYRGMTVSYMRQYAGSSGKNKGYSTDLYSLSAYMNF